VLNEVNTFPGFTPASQFPRMWAAAGLTYPALVDVLVRTAAGTVKTVFTFPDDIPVTAFSKKVIAADHCFTMGDGKGRLAANQACDQACAPASANGIAVSCANGQLTCACGADAGLAPAEARRSPIVETALPSVGAKDLKTFCADLSQQTSQQMNGIAFFLRSYCAFSGCRAPDDLGSRFGWPVACDDEARTFECACASGVRGRDILVTHDTLAKMNELSQNALGTDCGPIVGGPKLGVLDGACLARCAQEGYASGWGASCGSSQFAECICLKSLPD
jgi:hypothetical protein